MEITEYNGEGFKIACNLKIDNSVYEYAGFRSW